ncbi:MAG: TetR/AcrR family transcriptional regulator [Alkalispirochaeta sp.]
MNITDRQQEIMDTAIAIIAEEGIQKLTTKALSRRIGISEPALYRHFENKLAILVAILEHFSQWSRIVLWEIVESDRSPEDKIRELFRRHAVRFVESPATSAVLFSEEIFKNHPELVQSMTGIMSAAEGFVRHILEEGIAAGRLRADVPLEHLAMVTLGALRLLVTRWRLNDYGFDLQAESDRLAGSVVAMVAVSP